MNNEIEVVKVIVDCPVTSFRYPHFQIVEQPTYLMPPPSTIYGHICSTLGEFIDRNEIEFAYTFNFEGKGRDMEHIHVAEINQTNRGRNLTKNIEAEVNPYNRQFLFNSTLTLYINGKDIEKIYNKFLSPEYVVILGRSQDIASYRKVEIVRLYKSEKAYFENTLLPIQYRKYTSLGIVEIMPKFINPYNRNEIVWEKYIQLNRRIFLDKDMENLPDKMLIWEDENKQVWINEQSDEHRGLKMGLEFLQFN